jgi:hypothetical protein
MLNGIDTSLIPYQNKICYECLNITSLQLNKVCMQYSFNVLLLWFSIGVSVGFALFVIVMLIKKRQ